MKKETKFVFGTILCTIGVLIMFLSGTCSLWFLISNSGNEPGLAIMFGGIPFAVGYGFFSLGKKLRR